MDYGLGSRDDGLGFRVASVGFSALPRSNVSIAATSVPPAPLRQHPPQGVGEGTGTAPHPPTLTFWHTHPPLHNPLQGGGGGGTETAWWGGMVAPPPPGRMLAWLPYTPAASFAPRVAGAACTQQGTGGYSVDPIVGNLI